MDFDVDRGLKRDSRSHHVGLFCSVRSMSRLSPGELVAFVDVCVCCRSCVVVSSLRVSFRFEACRPPQDGLYIIDVDSLPVRALYECSSTARTLLRFIVAARFCAAVLMATRPVRDSLLVSFSVPLYRPKAGSVSTQDEPLSNLYRLSTVLVVFRFLSSTVFVSCL